MIVGFIGLGNMGHNLALNISDKGHTVHVFNRTRSKTDKLVKEHPSIVPFNSIEDLVKSLEPGSRVIILMVSAGRAIDCICDELSMYLKEDDIVIDAGNSSYLDTIRRNSYKFAFVGAGVSGGEKGARNGPSIMVGCDKKVWPKISELFCDISAISISGNKCCKWFGPNGAGHYVKMLHNGIEYCDMASLAESYQILKTLGKDNLSISKIFKEWNEGELGCYLLEICIKIVQQTENGKFLIDCIEDAASQKGTGKDCIISGVELNTPIPTITESGFYRLLTSRINVRQNLSERVNKDLINGIEEYDGVFRIGSQCIEKALILCRAVAFVQGLNLLKNASAANLWDINFNDLCDAWSNGCIIRSKFLQQVQKIVTDVDVDFELSETFVGLVNENVGCLKKTVIYSTLKGIPTPCMSSCLNYVLGICEKRSNACLIQGMRDFFGGHTVKIMGEEENRHIEWEDD